MNEQMLLEEALEAWRDARGLVVEEARNVPAERYGFRPTGSVRSFGELVAHILEVSEMMVGELCRPDGDFLRRPFPDLIAEYANDVRDLREKEPLLEALDATLERGEARFREAGAAHLVGPIRRFDGQEASRLAWMHHGIAQEMYHCGQLTLYARLLGLVPALTRRIQGGE
jgi:uncharacterized damage-inducible protein DinB